MKARILNPLYVLLVSFLIFSMTDNSVFAGENSEKVFKGEKITIRVDGLSCPFCAYGLEKKLESLDGVEKIDIKVNDGAVLLYLEEEAEIAESVLRKKVEEAGFTPREITTMKSGDGVDTTARKITLRIEGMRCENCVSNVKKVLSAVGCAKDIEVNLEKNQATLTCSGGISKQERLVEEVEKLGFKAEVTNASQE